MVKAIELKFRKISLLGKILLLLFSVLSLVARGQTDIESLKKTFVTYSKCAEKNDNEFVLGFFYPKVYRFLPKEEILKSMEVSDSDTTRKITVHGTKLVDVSGFLEIRGIKYAYVKYGFIMDITFHSQEQNHIEGSEADYTFEVLKEQYGSANVDYDRNMGRLVVKGTNGAFAINDPAYQGWSFVENNNTMIAYLDKLLPKKVIEAF